MWKDFYKSKNKPQKNPFEYNIDNFKNIDPELVHYKQVLQFNPGIEELISIAIDNKDNIYVSGTNKVITYRYRMEVKEGQRARPLGLTERSRGG